MNPIPFTEFLDDVFDATNADGTNADWEEVLEINGPGDSHAQIDGEQEATLVGIIPYNKIRSAERFFLGFAYVSQNSGDPPTGGGNLVRENPCPHPWKPNLYASSFSTKPFIPEVATQANFKSFPPIFTPTLSLPPKFTSTVVNPISGQDGNNLKFLNYGSYSSAIATVKFRAFKYLCLENAAITAAQQSFWARKGKAVPAGDGRFEWRRNTWIDTNPRLDILSADGISQMAFAETSAAVVGPPAIPAGPIIGTVFPAPIGVTMGKCDFTVNWYNVPFNYISDDASVLYPSNILNCLGLVNSTTFLETFTAETILMKGAAFDTKPYCVPAIDGTPMLSVDVKLMFDYFEPESGNSASTFAGWNLLPFRVNGLWYGASRTTPGPGGGLNGVRLLQSIDMNTAFDNPNYAPN